MKTSQTRQLGPNNRDSFRPVLSADGEWVMYLSTLGTAPQVFISRTDGSDWRQLTSRGGAPYFDDAASVQLFAFNPSAIELAEPTPGNYLGPIAIHGDFGSLVSYGGVVEPVVVPFFGLAPGLVGVWQMDFAVPKSWSMRFISLDIQSLGMMGGGGYVDAIPVNTGVQD